MILNGTFVPFYFVAWRGVAGIDGGSGPRW